MELTAYQGAAARARKRPAANDLTLDAVLGLADAAGRVGSAYRRHLQAGPTEPAYKSRMRDALGEVMSHVAVTAQQLGLNLDDVATANLSVMADRWRPTPSDQIPLDADYPVGEQLPRIGRFVFTVTHDAAGRPTSRVTLDGVQMGDPITNASRVQDDYCYHDVFHLAYAAVLGWSPVVRSLLKRKRKSDLQVDEAEDGGRAIAVEEGISMLVFGYASEHEYLEGITEIDNAILDAIQLLVAQLEVSVHRAADWEKAILTGYDAWRQLRRRGGGVVELDLRHQALKVIDVPTS